LEVQQQILVLVLILLCAEAGKGPPLANLAALEVPAEVELSQVQVLPPLEAAALLAKVVAELPEVLGIMVVLEVLRLVLVPHLLYVIVMV
jgi:hypothetical protein